MEVDVHITMAGDVGGLHSCRRTWKFEAEKEAGWARTWGTLSGKMRRRGAEKKTPGSTHVVGVE